RGYPDRAQCPGEIVRCDLWISAGDAGGGFAGFAGRSDRGAWLLGHRRLISIGAPATPCQPDLASSRWSQALASFQSRITLCGEIFSTSAVSSTLKPPRNRSSITFAFRGSIFAMPVKA